ncbi:MAG: PLD nuclease N-terminal domain-containing protein [Oscillospiraceae bacterium]|nr:PLD nuclease N-terminal domain-containing protein [Oscillospiraceae bacterium]
MANSLNTLVSFLPLIIPLAIIQFGLMIAALVHILKHDTYKTGNRLLWIIICICVNTIGPILYFVIGRGDE